MVRTTRPCRRASSNGVFLHFDLSSLASTTQGTSTSTTLTSAGAPGRSGDREPRLLGATQDLKGVPAGERSRVVAAPGEPDEADVALQHDRLRLPRDAGKAEAGGELALVHHAFADQVRILGMVDDER